MSKIGWKPVKPKRREADPGFVPAGKGLRTNTREGRLRDSFLIPPFTVWDTQSADWQEQKKWWLKLGIQSELGRDVAVYHSTNPVMQALGMISIFDPVICELVYSWFCPPGGRVLDPFAGGSVRGIVASVLGCRYWGCDLSRRQIEANRAQLNAETTGEYPPQWFCGDSLTELDDAPRADLVFSCPPYGSLEVYSDDPRDISNRDYQGFLDGYRAIIAKVCGRLRNDRFACFVVGNFRDKKTGTIHDLVGDTVRAFEDAGLAFYNDAVLLGSSASAALRARKIFGGGRKLVRIHQNVLIFIKGEAPRWSTSNGES